MVCYVAFSCGKISRFFPIFFHPLLIEFLLKLYLLCHVYVVSVDGGTQAERFSRLGCFGSTGVLEGD